MRTVAIAWSCCALGLLASACGGETNAQEPKEPAAAGEAILRAIGEGDLVAVRAALDAGERADFRARDKPIVVLAVASGRTDIVALLLDRGADLEAATDLGITPLLAAITTGRSDCAHMLLDRGANVNVANSAGASALILAAAGADEDLALRLLEKGADPKATSHRNKSTALMLAASKDRIRLMKALVAAGADVAAVDASGNTAMTYAKSEAARAVLTAAGAGTEELGADPDAPDAVRRAFADYQRAVREASDDAGSTVSRTTIEMFAGYRDAALRADRATLAERPVAEQFAVLRLRTAFPADELENMSGEQLVSAGVKRGFIDKDSTAAVQLGVIRVTGRGASAAVEMNGGPVGSQLMFTKEDDGWKLDLAQQMAQGEAALRTALQQFEGSREQQLVALLEAVVGEPIGDEIWQPLRR